MTMGVEEAMSAMTVISQDPTVMPEIPELITPEITPVAEPEVTSAATSIQIDTTHKHVLNVPITTARVAGYDTGTSDINWTAEDWSRFPHSKHIHINQDPRTSPLLGNVLDIEGGAWTIEEAVVAAKFRQEHGRANNFYISAGAVSSLKSALSAAGIKKAYLWVANWNLNQAQATNLIETSGEYQIVCVQWASPTSNPLTIVPGSHLTLSEANVDLSVALDTWLAENPSPPPVEPPKPIVMEAILMVPEVPAIPAHTLTITSHDNGKTWA